MNLFGTVELATAKSTIVLLDDIVVDNQENQTKRVSCKNTIGATEGARVELSIKGKCILRARYASFFLPLFFAVLGISLSFLTTSEIMRFAIISVAILGGFLITTVLVAILNCKSKSKYNIERVITE